MGIHFFTAKISKTSSLSSYKGKEHDNKYKHLYIVNQWKIQEIQSKYSNKHFNPLYVVLIGFFVYVNNKDRVWRRKWT